jgi:Fur family ferric uptake transcriptional regulator
MTTNMDLHNRGLKVTTPRLRILHILENSKDHLRAEDIHRILAEEGSQLGLATVYRVLTQFEAAGLIKKHHFAEGHAVFELERGVHHDHLVCIQCERVDEFIDPEIEARQEYVAQRFGYEITDHSLYLYGVCQGCRQK